MLYIIYTIVGGPYYKFSYKQEVKNLEADSRTFFIFFDEMAFFGKVTRFWRSAVSD